jgi:membrane protease YdiL (CAAX protease family)
MNLEAASISSQPALLKPFWLAFIGPAWIVSLLFYALIAFIRFFAFFSPYELQEVFFLQTVAMWALPFLFLTPSGRIEIGLSERRLAPRTLLFSALAGVTCALIFFGAGMAIYDHSPNNWCISIRNYLHLDEMHGIMSPSALFALYALPAIFLNPIGEELLFRGFIQQAFARRFNATVGTIVSSFLFGLIYLYLHGIWHDTTGFHLRAASAAIAVCLMALTGFVFALCRALSRSLWPAMVAHAAFNLTLLGAAIVKFAR